MIVSAEFVAGVVAPGDFPAERLPEVALVGRSNVGKSSLINALARRRIARTSRAPGRTRTVNVYRIRRGTAPAVYLVDLPGYGYARAPRAGAGPGSRSPAERRRAAALEFDRMLQAYFGRPGARGALLLVDA
ncbi:MAG: hypothetical protein FJW23_12795, partial [Acidimicrobiia bacterium]|nr:hypothetical protein [Acidimicrobiia bacterium]